MAITFHVALCLKLTASADELTDPSAADYFMRAIVFLEDSRALDCGERWGKVTPMALICIMVFNCNTASQRGVLKRD